MRPNFLNAVAYTMVHLIALVGILWVVPTADAVALCITLYVLRMFGITAGYHRYFSHRSYKTSRPFQFVLALLGTTAAQKGVLWWAAHHRHHHRHSDKPTDLHSPKQHGFLWAHMGWFLSTDNQQTDINSIRDFARYPELRWLNTWYVVPPALLAGATYVAAGMPGLVWGFAFSTVCCWHATYCINSLAHVIGYRRFKTNDNSRNSFVLALLTLGEGWHNNHHRHPVSARHGLANWELDLTYLVLLVLSRIGIIWDLRNPPERAVAECHQRTAQQPVPTEDCPIIATTKGRCWTDQDGLLRVMFSDGAFIGLDDARAITLACEQVIDARPRLAVVDFRKARGISWAARNYFFHDPRHLETYIAVAVVVRTRIGKAVGHVLDLLLGTKRPARVFTNENHATAWLKLANTASQVWPK